MDVYYNREMGYKSHVTAKNGFISPRPLTEDTLLYFLVNRTVEHS